MRKLLILAALILGSLPMLFGQTARWDSQVLTTNTPQPTPGNLYPVYAVPGSTVRICDFPANGSYSGGNVTVPCSNLTTTYTSNSTGTTCSTSTQLTTPFSSVCTNTADSSGNIGIWALPGAYSYEVTTSYGTFGPYPFGVDSGGVFCVQCVSKGKVIYASSVCAADSNISTGGGTDDSVCLQGILTNMSNSGGGTLVQDGVSLISSANVPINTTGQTTALQMGSNTTIACTKNGGYYLADNSNVAMLGNDISGVPTTALFQTNLAVLGCTFNGNGANQSRFEQGNSGNGWVFGVWFGAFDGLTLRDDTILNARTFAWVFSTGQSVFADNLSSVHTVLGGGNNWDGLHFWGTLKYLNFHTFLDVNGDDDALAFNTDEGVADFNVSPTAWRINRYPQAGGDINDVTIDDVFLINVNSVLRWTGSSTANGVPTVSNITLKNIHGTLGNFQSALSGVTATGGITIDGWNVVNTGGSNTLSIPPNANPVWLTNIQSNLAIDLGSGAVGATMITPTVKTINTGVLGAENPVYNPSSSLPLLSLSDAGDIYLGFSQPDIWYRVNSLNALQLNSATGTGYNASLALPSTTRLLAQGIAAVGQLTGSQAITVTVQAAAGAGATSACLTTCSLTSGIVSVHAAGSPTTGQLTKIATTGSATAGPLSCSVTGAGGAGDPDSTALHPQEDLTGASNGQFFIFTKVAPSAGSTYVFSYVCAQ